MNPWIHGSAAGAAARAAAGAAAGAAASAAAVCIYYVIEDASRHRHPPVWEHYVFCLRRLAFSFSIIFRLFRTFPDLSGFPKWRPRHPIEIERVMHGPFQSFQKLRNQNGASDTPSR